MGTPVDPQDPVQFPIAPLAGEALEKMQKSWRRADLNRYLRRFMHIPVPEMPDEVWSYERIHLDVGCGQGLFVFTEAARHPKTAFVGVDKSPVRINRLKERSLGMCNVFPLHTNVTPLLARLPDESLDGLTIFYPNPWWPVKHAGKRWSYHPVLCEFSRIMRPNGIILLASNEHFYLREWLTAACHHPRLSHLKIDYCGPVRCDEPRTHFEAQFLDRQQSLGEITLRHL